MKKMIWQTVRIAAMLIMIVPFLAKGDSGGLKKFEKLCVFGDSLSDVGNVFAKSGGIIPPEERYFSGRFSNGPIWADYTAIMLGLDLMASVEDPGCNLSASFGHGGSGTGVSNMTPDGLLTVRGLTGQVDDYHTATGGSADPNALYIIWSGTNDYLLQGVPGIPTGGPPESVGNIVSAIVNLYRMGARNFAVFNLPDLGQTPIAAIIEQEKPGTQAALTAATNLHNTLLNSALGDLPSPQDTRLRLLDMHALHQKISMAPVNFGFKNSITDPGPAINCLIPLTAPQNCDPIGQDRYAASASIIWDSMHPTANLHLYIAQEVLETLGRPTQAVILDILPFRDPNLFDPREHPRHRFLPIAILTTPTFSAQQVDPLTVRLEPTGLRAVPGLTRVEDVNQDGEMDLILRFTSNKLDISCGDNTALVLTGQTYDGTAVIGTDSIKVMDCE